MAERIRRHVKEHENTIGDVVKQALDALISDQILLVKNKRKALGSSPGLI